jgi:hypothetical protein
MSESWGVHVHVHTLHTYIHVRNVVLCNNKKCTRRNSFLAWFEPVGLFFWPC